MHEQCCQRRRNRNEQRNDRCIVDTAHRTERRQREGCRPGCCSRQLDPDQLCQKRRDRRNHDAAEQPSHDAQRRQQGHCPALHRRRFDGIGGGQAAWAAEEHDTEHPHEAGCREAGGERQKRTHRGRQEAQDRLGHLRPGQDRLEQQPLRNEAVEWGQGRDGQCSDQEIKCGLRHSVNKPAKPVEIFASGCMQHRSCAKEQKRLEP